MNLQIRRKQTKDFVYFEATFLGGNLLAFSLDDLINQLTNIYGFKIPLI